MKNSFSYDTVKEYLSSIGKWDEFSSLVKKEQNVTLVTGLWDLGRSKLSGWAQRDFEIYKQNFFKLLKTDIPMCIWIPSSLEDEVWKIRSKENTRVYIKEVEDFKTWFPFYNEHEALRTNLIWQESAPWLKDSPQAALEMYNPMMMAKMFMVNDSAILNPFDTEYFYWVDGGLAATISEDALTNERIYQNISKVYKDKIIHVAYPYEPSTEIHGYAKEPFYKECNIPNTEKVIYISRGGFWGGTKELIHKYNSEYYHILQRTIASGNIGADECLFTIAAYRYTDLIERFVIDQNGLMYPFFETMKDVNDSLEKRKQHRIVDETNAIVNLYVLGYNSPSQFELLCKNLKEYDDQLFNKTRKILINNTLDESLFAEYDRICTLYNFEEIHQSNIGICGGRQLAAEHFENSDADFYMFFEDDMFVNGVECSNQTCRNGFVKYVPNLHTTLLKIMLQHKFDFLKLSFSEFYGDNSVQWAWYNVPQNIRTDIWPSYDKLPEQGTDPNAPKTNFKNIFITDGVSYITGDIYYSNWPQIVSREGNKKMFLDTRWEKPFEQTWMSHMFQETLKGNLKPAILLASPITHDRTSHYEAGERREN